MKKIAIIDDEQDILNILERYLSKTARFEIKTFVNPDTAFHSVMNDSYDLILLDIMMPQKNGIDLLKEIKAKKLHAKVILMTAYSTLDKTIQAYEVGADDYIAKPIISLKDVEVKVLDALGI
mgnify:CR=1 FL=1